MPVTNKRRLAVDETTIEDEAMEKAIEYLQSRLKPEELSHLKAMLKGEQPEAEAEAEDGQLDRMVTEDSGPAAFKGMPKRGASMASDSKGNSFHDRYPDVARIKVWL